MKSKFDELLESRIVNFEDETKDYILQEGFFSNLGSGILNFFKNRIKSIGRNYVSRFKQDFGSGEKSVEIDEKIVEGISSFLQDRDTSRKFINIEYTPKKGTPVSIRNVGINIKKVNDILSRIENGRYDLNYIKNTMLVSNNKPLANVSNEMVLALVNTPYKDIIRTFRNDIINKYFPDFKNDNKELIKEFGNYLSTTRPNTQKDIIIKIVLVYMFSNTNFTLKIKDR
jgi:hypothetical protein